MERRFGFLLALAAMLVACSGGAQGELADAEDRWLATGVSDYQLKVELRCLCPPDVAGPFVVNVIDGAIDEISYEGAPIEATRGTPTIAFTVEGLFGIVNDNMAADVLTVTYDDELGYPRLIVIDEDQETIDDEWSVSVEVTANGN